MTKLEIYVQNQYSNEPRWFEEEISNPYHTNRLSRVMKYKNYLDGRHSILGRNNFQYKGEEFNTSKMILQTAKTICNFHTTYLMGNPLSLEGTDNKVRTYEGIYRKGRYKKIDYKIYDDLIKYGDAFEYVYFDNEIKSKVIDTLDSYPIIDTNGDYIGFIEHYQDSITGIEKYVIYDVDKVTTYFNDGNRENVTKTINISGLPIHYTTNSVNGMFGDSVLGDIIPILDKIEYLLNKMDDSISTMSLNPIPYITGQRLDTPLDADVTGYLLNLEDGTEFKYAVANLDSESIKVLYNALLNHLWIVARVPSVVMGQSNVANVSEVSLKLLYTLSGNMAKENSVYLEDGILDRIDAIDRLLAIKGITFSEDEYIGISFNYNRPMDESEYIDMLSKQYNDGALSIETYLGKSPLTSSVVEELGRLVQPVDNSVDK